MSDKFKRYFTRSLLKEMGEQPAPVNPVANDAEVFDGSFEDENTAGQLEGEVDSISIDPEQRDMILRKADSYAEMISNQVLPTLRKLHTDIISGVFASVAPDIKGISGINEDLAELSEALRGRVKDAVIKAGKEQQ